MAAEATHAPDHKPKAKIFISYSRKDMSFADRFDAALKARGFEPLIDREEIYAFEDWWKRIQALIGRADTVVFVLSPDAVQSEVALKEVAYAASLNKRFAPIVCRRVEDSAVPDALRRLNFIFFDDPERFEVSADTLANALESDINWIRQHTEFGEAERRWSSAGRPNGLLLQSPTLDLAEYWLASRPRNAPEPTEEIRSYVTASRKQARVSKRLWRALLTSIFTLLAGIIVGLVGWINQLYIATQWRWWTVTRPYMVSEVRPYVLSAAKENALKQGDSFKECAQDCPEMVVVPAGSFTMGGDQLQQHQVTIDKRFAVSKFELTFAEWDACVSSGGCNGYKPSDFGWGHGQQPVINVSWDNAQLYVAWLSEVTGKPYRLLTEAEYEYATRAGTRTEYPWGDDINLNRQTMANCNGCGSKWDYKQAAPVGSFAANAFGLYDMVGNVWEWVEDCYHPSYEIVTAQGKVDAPADGSAWTNGDCGNRVVRGGSYRNPPDFLRSAFRLRYTADARIDILGFRVGRALIAP
jgi:formylglycine-generating enzyme required for sulfatase activity